MKVHKDKNNKIVIKDNSNIHGTSYMYQRCLFKKQFLLSIDVSWTHTRTVLKNAKIMG